MIEKLGPNGMIFLPVPGTKYYLMDFPVTERQYGSGDSDLPAVWVSWLQARDFAQKHNLILPPQWLWELAARAGTQTQYWWGDQYEKGRFNCSCEKLKGRNLKGAYAPNPWGFYDMLGNVGEWVSNGWTISMWRRAAMGGSYLSPPYPYHVKERDEETCAVPWIGFRLAFIEGETVV